jgi:hypothetical protein
MILDIWQMRRMQISASEDTAKSRRWLIVAAATSSTLACIALYASLAPWWIIGICWIATACLVFVMALHQHNAQIAITEQAPIPRHELHAIGERVAEDLSIEILCDRDELALPSPVTMIYWLTEHRLHLRLSSAIDGLDHDHYADMARSVFEHKLSAWDMQTRIATARHLDGTLGKANLTFVFLPQPSNHKILAHRARHSSHQ